jgi:hypothetical protein
MNYDIYRAMDTLSTRRGVYTNSESYYQGDQSEVFAHTKWTNLFRANGTYVLNFCKTVVDTVLDRLEISTVEATTKAATKTVGQIWEDNELQIDAREIHRRALVFGECYAIVWPDSDGKVTITYNSPMTTTMIYDEENPRIKKAAAKLWEQTDSFNSTVTYMTLYYADRIEKYRRAGEVATHAGSGDYNGWGKPYEIVDNPWNAIPVFHFRTHRPFGTPEHAGAIGAQDAINKLVNNHMLTVDYQGAPQRYALSSGGNASEFEDFDEGEAARENIASLKSGPGELWYLNGVTQVGQFNPADPMVFTNPILEYVKYMASLTHTPLHFFVSTTVFGSGEALRSAEAPLTKKVRDRQLSFGTTWRELFKFALRIEGIDADVQVQWISPESLDTTDNWQIASIKRSLGMPLHTVLEEMGYDSEIAKQISESAKKEAEANAKAQTAGVANGDGVGTPQEAALGMNAHNLAVHQAAQNAQASDNANTKGN